MKRQGGSATKALAKKLANEGVGEMDELHEGTQKVEKTIEYQDTFSDILKLGWNSLKNPFLGRISRGEYIVGGIIARVIYALFAILLIVIGLTIRNFGDDTVVWYVYDMLLRPVLILTGLVFTISQRSLVVKRFHDISMSGWNALAFIIPLYNIYLLITILFQEGDVGLNDYGDDPLDKQPVGNTWYIMLYVISLCIALSPLLISLSGLSMHDFTYTSTSDTLEGVTPEEEEKCKKEGGRRQRAGMAREFVCIFGYGDGGKICKSSDECEGGCMIDKNEYLLKLRECTEKGTCRVDPPKIMVGTCAYDSNIYGCKGTIEFGGLLCGD